METSLTTIQSTSSASFKSPEEVRPYPKALPRKRKGGRNPGRTRILTDTPEKEAIEVEYDAREEKKTDERQNPTGGGYCFLREENRRLGSGVSADEEFPILKEIQIILKRAEQHTKQSATIEIDHDDEKVINEDVTHGEFREMEEFDTERYTLLSKTQSLVDKSNFDTVNHKPRTNQTHFNLDALNNDNKQQFDMSQNSNVTETDGVIKSDSFRSYGTSSEDAISQNNKEADLIESTIGNFGLWQFRISFLLSLLKFPMAWIQLSIVFLAPPTEFWCRQPQQFKNITFPKWRQISGIELPDNANKNEGQTKMTNDTCNKNFRCPWGYEYNTSQIASSIITEWNLVCSRAHLAELTQVTLMFGVLLGSIIIGLAADKFGRKKVLLASILLQTLFGLITAIVPWFGVFTITRFFLGFADGGVMVISFVLCMEIVGGKWRTIVPILYQIPFGIGNSLMAIIAYFLRNWRDLQFTLSALSSFYATYICLIPESPRWLFITMETEKTVKLLEKAADVNKLDKSQIRSIVERLSNNKAHFVKQNFGVGVLFKTPQMRKRSTLLCMSSFIAGMSFYGFSQYLAEISTNIYFATFLGGLIIIPGGFLCIIVVTKCGRRISIAAATLYVAICFFGICLFPIGVYRNDWPRVVLEVNGLLGMSIAYPALYLYISELYPTVLRNSGLGTTVMFSRLGSMLAPVLLATTKVLPFLPLIIFGCLSIFQASLILPLPETLNTALPDIVNDIEMSDVSRYPAEDVTSKLLKSKTEDIRK
ncbi:hypothetical protein RN001_006556 [Aquatica leii]|uniref:Major facilitator superfamily (MFS) profile domain-containing protein n=1 Tax=Aquatica leii TaxID=1421715 RepID=A0AAN7Q598_9COLE|nr:hypothetical protein RN001_006556 [Aquatica leii]